MPKQTDTYYHGVEGLVEVGRSFYGYEIRVQEMLLDGYQDGEDMKIRKFIAFTEILDVAETLTYSYIDTIKENQKSDKHYFTIVVVHWVGCRSYNIYHKVISPEGSFKDHVDHKYKWRHQYGRFKKHEITSEEDSLGPEGSSSDTDSEETEEKKAIDITDIVNCYPPEEAIKALEQKIFSKEDISDKGQDTEKEVIKKPKEPLPIHRPMGREETERRTEKGPKKGSESSLRVKKSGVSKCSKHKGRRKEGTHSESYERWLKDQKSNSSGEDDKGGETGGNP